MTRHFYTDPLAAAWMAKRFGMDIRLDRPEGKVFLETTLIHGLSEWRDAISATTGYKFYIHIDSLHLLEPLAGDLVEYRGQISRCSPEAYYVRDDKAEHRSTLIAQCYAAELAANGKIWIIQRNGIAFHWPESEDA